MNRPIKILIHGLTGNLGGMENLIINYYRHINQEIIHFDFLCVNQKPANYQEVINKGSKVYIIPGRKKLVTQYRKLVSIFQENKYDGFWSNRNSLFGTLIFFKLAYKYGIPLRILHAHSTGNVGHWIYGGLLHIIEKYRIEKYVTDFWACSIEAGNYSFKENIIKSNNFRIINNAIDLEMFTFKNDKRNAARKELCLNDKLVIGHVGRFTIEKNHKFLIRVFYEMYKKNSNIILLLVGGGKLKIKIETMARSLNIEKAVLFLGVRSDIYNLLNAMDIFLFPSVFEGLGISIIEAQAASLNCFVSTNIPSAAKVTNLITFVDLKKSPGEWADMILAQKYLNRIDMSEEIRNAGYDIKKEAIKLEQYLLDRIESVNYV